MEKTIFAVYGVSGCGRSIMPTAREQLFNLGIPLDQLVFVDDLSPLFHCNGHDVLNYEKFIDKSSSRFAVLAVADGEMRQKLADKCVLSGTGSWTIISSKAVVMDDAKIGVGAMISPFATIASNVQIGKHFHANLYSYVEHDCVIGDFVTFAPGAKCNGNIVIEDHAYIGSGAIIKQGKRERPLIIGRHAVVGMGAVVTRDVPAGVTVVGNPARVLVK